MKNYLKIRGSRTIFVTAGAMLCSLVSPSGAFAGGLFGSDPVPIPRSYSEQCCKKKPNAASGEEDCCNYTYPTAYGDDMEWRVATCEGRKRGEISCDCMWDDTADAPDGCTC